MAVYTKITIFLRCDSMVDLYHCFGRTCYLQL